MGCPIKITDNHPWESRLIEAEDIGNLQKIANVSVEDLLKERNTNLLVFPSDLNKYKDDIGKNYICSLRKRDENWEISTGNLMGFIGIGDTQISIRSRFAKEDKEDYFLHYLLKKVFSIHLFNLKHSSSSEPVFDFLLYLFPYFLKKALRQGLFRKYQKKEYNDANIRGVVNVNRHIRQNIPFRGCVSYNTRMFSYDNPVTQLIRHTIEYIDGKGMGKAILQNDMDTKEAVSIIREATLSYAVGDRIQIIEANLRPLKHPYFSEYTILQKICLQILHHKNIKFGQEKNKVYGILFDGAWLWEEYLNTILKQEDFNHPKNKTKEGGFPMFETPQAEDLFSRNSRRLYPDFYKDDYILDAKYKHLDGEVGREDLYQVVTYMYCKQSKHGGYIYPSAEKNATVHSYKLAGYGGKMSIIPFLVSQEDSINDWKVFIESMKQSENGLIEAIYNSCKN